jgi:hypothetical protein
VITIILAAPDTCILEKSHILKNRCVKTIDSTGINVLALFAGPLSALFYVPSYHVLGNVVSRVDMHYRKGSVTLPSHFLLAVRQ